MGVALSRSNFDEWMEIFESDRETKNFLNTLEEHLGSKVNPAEWNSSDGESVRLGSYSSYNLFRCIFAHLNNGDPWEIDEEDAENWNLILDQLPPTGEGSIPYATTILDSGDTDTLFIPVLFENPLEYGDEESAIYVSSIPGALIALKFVAERFEFDLGGDPERERADDQWLPMAVFRNFIRAIYLFLSEQPMTCIELG